MGTFYRAVLDDNFADVEAITQDVSRRRNVKFASASHASILQMFRFGQNSVLVEMSGQRFHGAELQIFQEDGADLLGLIFIDDEFAVDPVIAERS